MVTRATSIGGLHWDVPLYGHGAALGARAAAGSPPLPPLRAGRARAFLVPHKWFPPAAYGCMGPHIAHQ
eukprot:2581641-Prymnesium_polylepis.2